MGARFGLLAIVAVMTAALPAFAAVEPLSESQRAQVATARDFTETWDEAALYPLMQNVLKWDVLDEAGAMIPDYDALMAQPEEYRGRLFLVSGQLGRAPEPVQRRLSRPGPWDGRLHRYGLLYRINPDAVAVVLMVDPPPADKAPHVAAKVWTLCRFYKIWRFKDLEGRTTDYPLFVARTVSAATSGRSRPWTRSPSDLLRMLPVLALVGLGIWWMLRRAVKNAKAGAVLPSRVLRRTRQGEPTSDAPTPPPADLPADPAQALDRLAARNDVQEDDRRSDAP